MLPLPSLLLAVSSSVAAAEIPSFASVTNDTHGVWWVAGGQLRRRSLVLGVTAIQYAGMTDARTHASRYKEANDRRFGSNHSRWADASVSLLRKLGFNTAGPWSDLVVNAAAGRQELLYTPIVAFGNFHAEGYDTHFPDVFSPAFKGNATQTARRHVAPYKNDPALLGWFSDNELPWWREGGIATGKRHETSGTNLLWQFLTLHPDGSPGRVEAQRYLRSRLPRGHAALPLVTDRRPLVGPQEQLLWRVAVEHEVSFAFNASRAYFSQVHAAIKAVDANHLLLGAKFTGIDYGATATSSDGFDAILRGARGFVDAHSIDIYAFTPGCDLLQHYYDIAGVPFLLAESMGFRGTINLSDDANILGAGPIVPDQAARAQAWSVFAQKALALPFVVGINHFSWVDEPKGGRGAPHCLPAGPCGEDSNYGLISVDGEPYTALQTEIARVLAQAEEIHRASHRECSLDSAGAFRPGAAAGQLQLVLGMPAPTQCLTAEPTGVVSAMPCATMPSQRWEVLQIGGSVGRRLRNVGSGLCLHIELADTHSHQLRADGNCSTPADWHWPPAWEHDYDCSLMQYCGWPTNATGPHGWAHNVCTYDQSCVTATAGGNAKVAGCVGAQRFAFVQ